MRPPVTAGRPDPGAPVETAASGRWSRPEPRNTRAETPESDTNSLTAHMEENTHDYDIQRPNYETF